MKISEYKKRKRLTEQLLDNANLVDMEDSDSPDNSRGDALDGLNSESNFNKFK